MIERTTTTVDGQQVDLVTVSHGAWRLELTSLGARIVALHVPDDEGRTVDVVLQRPTLAEMATDDNYFGATAGRYANRIPDGRFELDGRTVQLTQNEGANHLHGGHEGFDKHLWTTSVDADHDAVTFSRRSPDGEEGYPGTLDVSITYTLRPPSLGIEIRAESDATTIANIVNHAYVNVAGHDSGTVLDHRLQVHAGFYTPVDADLLATGEVLAVDGTPFDFRTPTPIGSRIREVANGAAGRSTEDSAGYDHNWVLDGAGMREVLAVVDPASGRTMRLSTDQPGLQIYTGGYLAGVTAKGEHGTYPAFAGFTIETQTFPGSPVHAHFPSPQLDAHAPYRNHIEMTFSS